MTFSFKKEIVIFFAIYLLSSLFIYLLFNGGAYFRILRYSLFLNSPFSEANLTKAASESKNYYLYIPKINVSAPVILPKDNSNANILAGLEGGTILYPSSKLPGEIGQSVILGHSSKITWYRGEYAYIFSLLSKLQNGDEFYMVTCAYHTRCFHGKLNADLTESHQVRFFNPDELPSQIVKSHRMVIEDYLSQHQKNN